MFGILAVVSLLLCAAVVWLWARSFSEDRALVSWVWGGDRYTVWSHWGQMMFGGPAGEEDSSLHELAGRMSNEDFTWMTLGGGYVRGEVKEGSGTWEMYAWVRDQVGVRERLRGAQRVWLRGLENPDSFLAHHLMLLLVGEDAWRRRWVDERVQPWREGSAAGGQLILFVPHEGAAGWPNLSGREQIVERWHAVLDERRLRVFHGWVALVALALPVAWVARPRREPRTVGRWVFNGLALVSAVALVVTTVGLVRSYRAEDQWTFASRLERVEGFYQPLRWQGWVQSSEGKLRWVETQVPQHTGWTMRVLPAAFAPGYESKVTAQVPRAGAQGYTPKDERYVKWPGLLEYCVMPAQVMERQVQTPVPVPALTMTRSAQLTPTELARLEATAAAAARAAAAGATVPGRTVMNTVTLRVCYGLRSIAMPWWVLVAATAMLPLAWTWRQWRWSGRARRARRNLCRNCGYDLRASTERCPECGEAIAGEAGS